MEDTRFHQREHPRHHPLVNTENRSIIVFLTVCSKDRKPILNNQSAHELLRESWQKADNWLVGRYVIMSDHLHLFCAPGVVEYPSIRHWMKYWKALVSRSWPNPQQQPIWQVDGWDTQLRQGDSYSDKWRYVRNNPVRAGLVQNADLWPFQGEMNVLQWHDV